VASGNANRLRAIFDIALLVGSIGVTILTVGVVVALFAWVYSLPAAPPQQGAAPQVPRPRAAPPARQAPANAGSVAAAPSSNAAPVAAAEAPVPANPAPAAAAPNNPAPPPIRAAASAPANPPAGPAQAGEAVPPQGAPTFGPNSDAAKNRAIGAGLARLAQDPEAQRKLGLGNAAAAP